MRILIADDSALLREAVSRRLRSAGHEVVQAADGAEAIVRLLEGAIDIVLLDLHMPRVSGWVVCKLMKEDPAWCRIPVLILTMLDGPEDRFWAEKSGADGYLTKDEIDASLLERIGSLAASRALATLSAGTVAAPEPGSPDVLSRVCEVLDRKLFEATVVNEITQIALRSLDLRQALEQVLMWVARLVSFDAGALGLLSERLFVVHSSRPVTSPSMAGFYTKVARAVGEVAGATLTADDLALSHSGAEIEVVGEETPSRAWASWYVGPLQAHTRAVGALVLAAEAPGRFDEQARRTLRAITPAVVAVIEGARGFRRGVVADLEPSLSSL